MSERVSGPTRMGLTNRPAVSEAGMTTQSEEPVKVAFLANTPIHYQASLYRQLAADPRLDFMVFFASTAGLADMGYGSPGVVEKNVLDGYRSEFLRGAASNQDLE